MSTGHAAGGRRKTYDSQVLAAMYIELTANNGNVKRTARTMGIPDSTVRSYKARWDEAGPPLEVMEKVEAQATAYEDELERMARKTLTEYERMLDAQQVRPAQLVAGIGVFTDKARAVRGLAGAHVQHTLTVDVAHVAGQVSDLVRDALSSTAQRDLEIADADVVEVDEPPPALLPPR